MAALIGSAAPTQGSSTTLTAPASPASAATTTSTKPRRSASTLRHLIKEADRELGRAGKRRDALTVELGSVAPTDYTALARIGEQIAEAQAEIDRWEETWLELAEESHGE